MRPLTSPLVANLLAQHEPPCVSIYQPTQRSYPTSQQDPIVYKNLVRTAEEALRARHSPQEVAAVVERFHALADDRPFWLSRLDGLAVLGSKDLFEVVDLQRPVPQRAIAADSFHVKPLLRIVQSADRYQVLCLTRARVRLYEGNRDSLDEIEHPRVPTTVPETLGGRITDHNREVASYGLGTGSTHPAPGHPDVPHGHAAKGEDANNDTERFFRAVDRAVWEHVSRPSGLPLVVAALREHLAHFHRISHNNQLVPGGIEGNPDAWDQKRLLADAWKVIEPHYRDRLARLSDDFHVALARGMASDDLHQVAQAVCAGRVRHLFVDADRSLPGRLDRTSGAILAPEAASADVDDLLDDLAETVLKMDGSVVVVPGGQMPTQTGLAAIFRY